MTDIIPSTRPLSWTSTLQPGDVVAFRFPHEQDGPEHPKVRPALVINTAEKAGRRYAVLAYGTSNPKIRKDAYTLDVRIEAEIQKASLNKPTRFHVSRRIEVSLDDNAFDLKSSKQTPVLGQLSGKAKTRLTEVRERIRSDSNIDRPKLFGRRDSRRAVPTTTVKNFNSGRIVNMEARHV